MCSGACSDEIDDLLEIDRYLDRNPKYRLAFREFGTAMGAACQAEQSTEKDLAVDLKSYADAIITAWDSQMELTLYSDAPEDDLRPITKVMYASALLPGGKPIVLFLLPWPGVELICSVSKWIFRKDTIGY